MSRVVRQLVPAIALLIACRRAEVPVQQRAPSRVAATAEVSEPARVVGDWRAAGAQAASAEAAAEDASMPPPVALPTVPSASVAATSSTRTAAVSTARLEVAAAASVATPAIGAPIRRADLLATRDAVNAYRRSAGLAAYAFTDATPTVIRAIHVRELRDALTAARAALGLPFAFGEPVSAGSAVRAQHFTEIAAAAAVVNVPVTVSTCAKLSTACAPPTLPCVAPAACRFTGSPVPFDAPVRYDGELQLGGARYWRWVKHGEPSRPCTAAERSDTGQEGRGCAAGIGDALFLTPPFRLVP